MQGSQSLSSSSLLKNSLWMYVFSYLIAPLGYFTRILIARDVAMEEFGLLYTILGFVGLLAAYNGLGLTEALKYFIPKYLAEKQYNALWTTLVLSVVIQVLMSAFIFVCVWYGADWMAEKYFHAGELAWVLRYFCWYFVGTSCLQFLSAVFLGFQDSFSTKLMEFCSAITNVFFALGIFWAGVGALESYIWGWFIGIAISVGMGIFLYFRKYHPQLKQGNFQWNISFLKPFWQYGIWTFLSMNSGILLGRIDQQMIIALQGQSSAAIYSNYLSLINLFALGVLPLTGILVPTFTALIGQGEQQKLEKFKTQLYTWMIVFAVSLGCLLLALAPELAQLFYGQQYQASGSLLRIASLCYVFNILAILNFTLLSALGKVKIKTLLTLGVGVLNVFLNLFFIRWWGVYGALVATILGWLILGGVSWFLLRGQRPRILWSLVLKSGLFCLLAAALVFVILKLLAGEMLGVAWMSNLAVVGLGVLYYGCFLLYHKKAIQNGIKLLRTR